MTTVPADDLFAVLGLPRRYAIDLQDLERRFHERSRLLHPDRFVRATSRERRLSLERSTRLNDAYRTLRDGWRRAAHLLSLLAGDHLAPGVPAGSTPVVEDSAFLEEQLALREALAAARSRRDEGAVRAIADQARRALSALELEVARHLQREHPEPDSLAALRATLGRARYHQAVLAEAEAALEPRGTR
jgi:molecular chaperone HscB